MAILLGCRQQGGFICVREVYYSTQCFEEHWQICMFLVVSKLMNIAYADGARLPSKIVKQYTKKVSLSWIAKD